MPSPILRSHRADDGVQAETQFGAVPEQQAQPPSAELRTASAASQHGPARSTTARERLGLPRCRSREANRASSACRPAIRAATSARRSAISCGSSARRVAAVARMTPARDLRRVVERHVEPAQVDQQPQVLDIRVAVLAVGVLAPAGARAASRIARRTGPCRSTPRPVPPARRSSSAQQTLEWLECQEAAATAAGASSTRALSCASSRFMPAEPSIATSGDRSRHLPCICAAP